MPKVNVKDKRKKHLIDANIESISQRGLAATSITHICKAANMSRGIINFYFHSKDTMMLQTLKFILDEFKTSVMTQFEKLDSRQEEKYIEGYLAAFFAKKNFNKKRLSAWAAFCADASSHADFARAISKTDDEIMSYVLQKSGSAKKLASVILFARGAALSYLFDSQTSAQDFKNAAYAFIGSAPLTESTGQQPEPDDESHLQEIVEEQVAVEAEIKQAEIEEEARAVDNIKHEYLEEDKQIEHDDDEQIIEEEMIAHQEDDPEIDVMDKIAGADHHINDVDPLAPKIVEKEKFPEVQKEPAKPEATKPAKDSKKKRPKITQPNEEQLDFADLFSDKKFW